MRRTATFLAGLALLVALARGGDAVAAALRLPVPGAVVGLLAYLGLLAAGVFPASAAPARWLAGLLGALLVPPLVAVAGFGPVLAAGGWRLAVALVVGVIVTGVATAATFRLAVGATTR